MLSFAQLLAESFSDHIIYPDNDPDKPGPPKDPKKAPSFAEMDPHKHWAKHYSNHRVLTTMKSHPSFQDEWHQKRIEKEIPRAQAAMDKWANHPKFSPEEAGRRKQYHENLWNSAGKKGADIIPASIHAQHKARMDAAAKISSTPKEQSATPRAIARAEAGDRTKVTQDPRHMPHKWQDVASRTTEVAKREVPRREAPKAPEHVVALHKTLHAKGFDRVSKDELAKVVSSSDVQPRRVADIDVKAKRVNVKADKTVPQKQPGRGVGSVSQAAPSAGERARAKMKVKLGALSSVSGR